MTIQDCYNAIGGDFKDVMGRLRKEERVQKFALKFLDDGSYRLLCDSLEAENYSEAFRAAHTIKGVCQNLGFRQLFESVHELTEELRAEQYSDRLPDMMEKVTKDYEQTVGALIQYRDSNA